MDDHNDDGNQEQKLNSSRSDLLERLSTLTKHVAELKAKKKSMSKDFNDQIKEVDAEIEIVVTQLDVTK